MLEKEEGEEQFDLTLFILEKISFYKIFIIIFIISLIFFLFVYFFYFSYESFPFQENVCGDGTFSNSCSFVKPYFCFGNKLIEKVSVCGCPNVFAEKDGVCVSDYSHFPEEVFFEYYLDGKKDSIHFFVYEGVADYISDLPRNIYYSNGQNPLIIDFVMNTLEDDIQNEYIKSLAIHIKNLTSDEDDQFRIAVSLVQNIPYNFSDKTAQIGADKGVQYFRFPYEVLYDGAGVCGEKSILLVSLLKEMGYGVGLIYYPDENHEAVGVKCPVEHSINNSGYCFIETTAPSIITDNENSYLGLGKLSDNFKIIDVYDGKSISEDMREYKDAKRIIYFREKLEENRKLSPIEKIIYNRLQKKYNLREFYYV